MKTKGNKTTKVNIVTLGCSKNVVDSEVMMAQLRANEVDVTHDETNDEANVVIINTCGFIDNAKQESIDTILRYADAKENGLIDKLYVSGCLSERYKEDLAKEIPSVDAYFGTRDLPAILKKFKADYKHELVGERILSTPTHSAYFKISEGCDRPCSFCAIPIMRGNHVSKSMEDLVTEASKLAAKGTKELILIAQDLTYYGLDIYKDRKLADLLKRLSDVNGIEWIRLQYLYPAGFPLDVLDVIAERENICKYMDMPLQHASTNMLKAMRRGITREKTEELIYTIREKIPNVALRTSLITGHPGETVKDHKEMLEFVEKMRFERLGVFTYSHEDNTHSFSMKDSVTEKTKAKRQSEIMELQESISFELNQEKIDKTYKVLFDRVESGFFVGRTEFDSPEVDNEVLVPTEGNYVRIGDFANVLITDATEFDLYGKVI